jgi:hypothetical protein
MSDELQPRSEKPPEAAQETSAESRRAAKPEGRLLRLKTGYNPNSSSVGSDIPTFLGFAAAAGVLTTVLLNALGVVAELIRRGLSKKRADAERPDE